MHDANELYLPLYIATLVYILYIAMPVYILYIAMPINYDLIIYIARLRNIQLYNIINPECQYIF